jgi:hypothetical protein
MARQEIQNNILRNLALSYAGSNQAEEDSMRIFDTPGMEGLGKDLQAEWGKSDERRRIENLPAAQQKRLELKDELLPIQQERQKREFDSLSNTDKFKKGLSDAFGEGKTDHQQAYWESRKNQDLDIEAPRLQQILGTNPTFTRARDVLNLSNKADRDAREAAGLGLRENGYERAGQLLGTIGSDFNQDRLRNVWWLMNAPQAVTSVFNEFALSHRAPDLYSSDKVENSKNQELTLEPDNYAELMDRDIISLDKDGKAVLMAGVSRVDASEQANIGKYALSKRRYRPGMVDTLQLPSALAINAGVGLLNPLGGSNGYSAVFQSEDDPTRTNNIVGEVAAKYILGRTGNMLNWDDFKKVRPDVSKDEYMRYKAFKYDKEGDYNPLDGDFTIPTGILKGTSDGIHGAELQFLGRSMPLLTTLLPVAAAGIGTSVGAAWQPSKFDGWKQEKKDLNKIKNDQTKWINNQYKDNPEVRDAKVRDLTSELKAAKKQVWTSKTKEDRKEYMSINRIRNGIGAGLASYGAALGAGLLLENERRRRNQAENESKQTQL